MKFLSSIFSFDTLRIKRRLPKAFLLAIMIVVAANLVAWHFGKRGVLFSSIPRAMVEEYFEQMETPSDVWLIGNSTLYRSIDEELFKEVSGLDGKKQSIGSASLQAMSLLASHGLSRTTNTPKSIVLFVSKDDLNANGDRGIKSKRYISAINNPSVAEICYTYLPVFSYRYSIRKKFRFAMIDVLKNLKEMTQKDSREISLSTDITEKAKVYEDYSTDYEKTSLTNLGRDFTPKIDGLKELADACSERDVKLYIVFVPMAKAVVLWQEHYAPNHPWPAIMERIKEVGISNDFKVFDYSSSFPSTGEFFRDEYHLNDAAQKVFTRELSLRFKEELEQLN